MEVSYKSILVKKYSRGNSFAGENDVENKRYKINFFNKYSLGIILAALIYILLIGLVLFIYSMKPERKLFEDLNYKRKPMNGVLFHEDTLISCPTGTCKTKYEIEKDYFEKLKVSLMKEGYDLVDIESVYGGNHDSITKLELKTIVEHLVDLSLELKEEFEVPTIVKFKKFNKEFKRDVSSETEYKTRYKNFRKNRIMIETHNSDPNKLYTMGYTQAADVIGDELNFGILDQYPLRYMKDDRFTQTSGDKDRFNESGIVFDWRKKGHVVPIRDQGKCGTCWAFSTVDLVSSMMSIKKNVLKTYSTQQLADCVHPIFSCSRGGVPDIAIEYISRINLCTEEEYPYKMEDYACIQPNICKEKIPIDKISSLNRKNLESYLEEDGPFLLSMYTSKEFMFYKEGIYDGECEKRDNHGVVVVGHGYDKEKEVAYWIVKNSWGKDWGEDGYFRLLNAHKIVRGKKSYYCKMGLRSIGLKLK